MPRISQEPAILDAALSCFAERGYDATRVKHIAERAGVSEAALYRHYPSKEALAQHLYSQHLTYYADRLTAIADSTHPPVDKLVEVVHSVLAVYRRQPDAFVFTLLSTGTFMPQLPEGVAYPIDIVERIVTEAQDAGVVREGQPNLLSAILLGCVLRPIILATLSRPGALDLLGDTRHDLVIEQAAIAAIRRFP
ncbi:TetR/AcrR family transcriptional regulator [Micromonospora echinofusca]|uniref:TetR family transcriptional regulator n=1 Tax=Micromonospora echinofusca TaxID=47858 RepID=A0ABS3VNQ4_MICEH|nr:TetR/AcrR family transcriptional regulator [Micromonospora echinofusca]MBO4206169.1 TetR family transcriptional regulator [Micromonospora echinofusca]